MRKKLITLGIIGMIVLFSNQAQAAFILDTGEPQYAGNWSLGVFQNSSVSLAAKFTVDSGYTITDVAGWIAPGNISDTGWLTYALYPDNSGLPPSPGENNELFHGALLFDLGYLESYTANWSNSPTGWHGLSDLNWTIPAGSYWLSLETRDNSTFVGFMDYTVSNPAEDYAYLWPDESPNWKNFSGYNMDIGFQIQGISATPAPEPATILLLGTGLIGLAGIKRKIKK